MKKKQQFGNGKKTNYSSEMGKIPIIVRKWAKEQQFGNGQINNSPGNGKKKIIIPEGQMNHSSEMSKRTIVRKW